MHGDTLTVGTFIEGDELPMSLVEYRLPAYVRAGLGVVYERQVALLKIVGETRPATIEAVFVIDDEYMEIEGRCRRLLRMIADSPKKRPMLGEGEFPYVPTMTPEYRLALDEAEKKMGEGAIAEALVAEAVSIIAGQDVFASLDAEAVLPTFVRWTRPWLAHRPTPASGLLWAHRPARGRAGRGRRSGSRRTTRSRSRAPSGSTDDGPLPPGRHHLLDDVVLAVGGRS